MVASTIFSEGLGQLKANYVPLSPLSFLKRSADIRPNHPALIQGSRILTWAQVHDRCGRFASALSNLGIGRGSTVATLLPNVIAQYESHFSIPLTGAVLNAINTRLDAITVAYILEHSEAKVLLADPEYLATVNQAFALLKQAPLVIVVEDADNPLPYDAALLKYECLINNTEATNPQSLPIDEWEPIAVNYTSGTTGNPKGVVHPHRGAYLNALGNIVSWNMGTDPVYLWTLPMFHASGWCFAWTMAAIGGTNVCLRKIDASRIFDLIIEHDVTHFCAAPVVHSMLIKEQEANPRTLEHTVKALIAGSPPPASVIEGMERLGVEITHVYGLTETYGPCTYGLVKPEWRDLSTYERAALMSRQGVRYHVQEALEVMDPQTLQPVPADGETAGEVFIRGNIMMSGYLKDPAATDAAFSNGWFHTGDIAVRHPDGYIAITDRAKDIIISGGENISSVEVEAALYRHPQILHAAVVAMPDEHWGEVPCAFVEVKNPGVVTEEELISHCRQYLAGYKRPKKVIFADLPKTSTGKIQKFVLRTHAKAIAEPMIRQS